MKIRLLAAALSIPAAFSFDMSPAVAQEQIAAAVVVTATRQDQREDEVLASVSVIDRAQIERAGQSTLAELLATQPGVQVSTTGGPGSSSSLFIRGTSSKHALLLIDGVRVGSATSGQALFEAIPVGMIERIEILRGAASALYGSDAVGGVVHVFTRKGREGFHPEVFVGYGSNDTVQADASISGGRDRLRYSLSVGHEKTEGFNAKRDPARWVSSWSGNSYNPDDDGFRNQYVSASASIGFREQDELGVNAYYSDGRNWYDVNDFYDSYIDKTLSSASVFMRNRLSDAWSSTVRVGQGLDKTRDKADAGPSSLFESTQKQFVWQHDVHFGGGMLLAAYEYTREVVDGTTRYDQDRRSVNSVLLGWSGQFGAHSLQLNGRYDDNSQFGDKTTGLFAYGYQITPAWGLRGSIGSAFKAPSFNDLYWPGSGNPDLRPEVALNREVGLTWEEGAQKVDLTYFNNEVKQLIDWAPTPSGLWAPSNVGRASFEGVELAYGVSFGGYALKAGVDYLEAEDADGKRLPRRARVSGFARIDKHAGAWNWGVEWSGAGYRYEDELNTDRLGGYGLLNAYAHYQLMRDWRLEMRANNVLDKDYQRARGYRTDGANVFVGVRWAPR
ncbi:MAG TPA: TonB-dependent receptor [Gammaproteobacteria bacterium]|nr:TonB-dependent receptor [Gammaproteobacteria bacterium]